MEIDMKHFISTKNQMVQRFFVLGLSAVMLASITNAQYPGGGYPGGGYPGGGNPGGGLPVTNNGQFKITTENVANSSWITVFPTEEYKGNEASCTPRCNIVNVVGSVDAAGTNKSKFIIEWIGGGTAPNYAYVLLTADGRCDEGRGTFSLGLPEQTAPDQQPGIIRKIGRKIVKLKLDTNGKAEYTVDQNISVFAFNANPWGFAASSGHCSAGASLDFKVAGMSGPASNERVERLVGTPMNMVYLPFPESVDNTDFEHQKFEFGVVPITELQWSINPPVAPHLVDIGGKYHIWCDKTYQGSWSQPFQNMIYSITGEGFMWDQSINGVTAHKEFNAEDLEQMRKTPKSAKVKVKQTDPLHSITGPFEGDIDLKIWAPERIIWKEEKSTSRKYDGAEIGLSEVTVEAGKTQVLKMSVTSSHERSEEVTIGGGLTGSIKYISVKGDAQVKYGHKWTVSAMTGSDYPVTPSVTTTYYVEVTDTTTNMNRKLAQYGASGYEFDFGNIIQNSKPPTRTLQWKERPAQ
jgi:hypothetical protein